MVARRLKKYETGEASNFVTRKQALRKLQLNLKDFRRLCILKGVHPREPRNRKRAQKGDLTKVKTLYHEKDIRFLLHEPIVWKFRDFKVFLKKLKRATAKGEETAAERLRANKPRYSLDHVVKERYPTFVDALRDLEDCLCLCFLYSTFPKSARAPTEMVSLCRRLCVEFMHFVIEAKALRRVFVSIKGYYYQAEIVGQTVTWIVPHPFAYERPLQNVDFKLMSIFVEFYTTMLGFVNFRLYHSLNLCYPPAIPYRSEAADSGSNEETLLERVAALNHSLMKTVNDVNNGGSGAEEDKVELDSIPINGEVENNEDVIAARKAEVEREERFLNLFKGLKFFLNREVPREPLVFMIRSFGGQVSWDASVAEGATFSDSDPSVTHQICDRPRELIDMKHIGRDYVQPQWIFDSINRKELLPTHKYFAGEVLPPHLSPFIKEDRRIGDYMPPEERELLGLQQDGTKADGQKNSDDDEQGEDESEVEEDDEVEDDDVEDDDKEQNVGKVTAGKAEKELSKAEAQALADKEEFRLREMMIKKKHRGLYKSMMKARKKRIHESKQLEYKRKLHDKADVAKSPARIPNKNKVKVKH